MRKRWIFALLTAWLVALAGASSASAQASAPICVVIGAPLSNVVVVTADTITNTQFGVVGQFNGRAVYGTGFVVDDSVRFAFTIAGDADNATMFLSGEVIGGTGTGTCEQNTGTSGCGAGTAVTYTLIPCQ